MTDRWTGPRNVVHIRGTVDAAGLVKSEYGKDRVSVTLVDVTQTSDDGTTEGLETRTLFVSQDGAPGHAFAGSIRQVAGLPAGSDLLAAIEGKVLDIDVALRPFTIKATGESGEMTLYRVTKIGGMTTTIDDIVKFVIGKTPAEVAKGRSVFAGSDYAKALASRPLIDKLLGGSVKLVGGVYTAA